MVRSFIVAFVLMATACGAPSKQNKTIIGSETQDEIPKEETETNTIIIMSEIPDGAVTGNFNLDASPFYAAVDLVDTENETTTIAFEDGALAQITIPEAIGASLSSVRFNGFDQDILLVNSVYKDPIFRKYYLYILKGGEWQPVVDGFILHVENISGDMVPIKVDPSNSNRMVRSYSVFDMDPESETKYSWILKEEVVDVLNR